ncbi:MAG TPA: metallophosphoesterase [Gemmatimonadaceae bacterium]|nr:metallophosphoesterase [Gemmatimonadaceae bacterium]
MVLDRLLRPRHWAARLADAAGLQTARPIEVDRVLIPVGRTSAAPPLKVAFASDFHAGATTAMRVLERACAAIADEKPDLVLLGGDFVTTRARYIRKLAPMLAEIPAPLGKFGVFGNHDHRANRAELTRALEGAGVRMLVNERVTLAAPHDDVTLFGLDDPIRGAPSYGEAAVRSPVQIVLMHAPDGLITLGDRHFDLAVCGHTHGGQITLGPVKPYLPYGSLSREYSGGLYRLGPEGNRALVVSRGVGCSTIPIRLGARAQVHLFTIG